MANPQTESFPSKNPRTVFNRGLGRTGRSGVRAGAICFMSCDFELHGYGGILIKVTGVLDRIGGDQVLRGRLLSCSLRSRANCVRIRLTCALTSRSRSAACWVRHAPPRCWLAP